MFRFLCSIAHSRATGNVGGIIAGQIFPAKDVPKFTLAHSLSLGVWLAAMSGMSVERYIWNRRNRLRASMSEEEKQAQDDRGITGDAHYSYQYAL